MADTTLLKKVEELSARVVALETENRLLRQKLDAADSIQIITNQ